MKPSDLLLGAADSALRTLFARPRANRPSPAAAGSAAGPMNDEERRLSIALMRVNHVGEVCAQALYTAQALTTSNADLKRQLEQAAREETDHLAWTQQRLDELGGHTSLLNPFWYAGSFALGLIAGRLGDAVGLGFVSETERQVEAHLASHLERLPEQDHPSRAIVEQMRVDEAEHGQNARDAGGIELPHLVKDGMRRAAQVMTRTAHHV